MELYEIQNLLRQNIKPKFLVFVGSDYAIANSYIDNFSKFYNLPKQSLEDITKLKSLCQGNEMFSEDKLYVMKYPKDIASHEDIFSSCKDFMGNNMLIVVLSDIDKRTKFYKFLEGDILETCGGVVECNPQDLKTFRQMIEGTTKLSSDGVKLLAEICENNLGKFRLELNKVQCYASERNVTEDEALQELIKSGTIYTANKDVLFEFIGRVISAKNNMYELYEILKKQEESNLKLISLLYTTFRNQFICETVIQPTQESTGLTPFILNQCLRRKGIYSQADLRKALSLILKLEQGVKSGLFEEKQIIDYFLAQLLL